MSLPTGSAIARAMACPPSVALPQVRRSSSFSKSGTYRHRFLEAISAGTSRADALAAIPEEYREECEAIDLERLPTGLAAEVTFSWHPETLKVRELGRCLGRDYSAAPGCVVGTIDVLGVSHEGVYVGDFKGHDPVPVEGNAQLLFAALCACRTYNKQRAILEIIQLRGSSVHRSRCTVDLFDLGNFEAQLLSMVHRVRAAQAMVAEGRTPDVTEGDHCRYCPAFDACPAKTALLRVACGVEGPRLEPLTEATAADAYRQFLALKELGKRFGEALYAYAAERPIDLGDGRMFGRVEKQGNEKLDGDVVYDVVRDAYGQAAADLAVKRTATKKSIEAAIRHAKDVDGLNGPMSTAKAMILDRVRDAGGSERKSRVVVEEYRAALPAKEGA